MSCHALSSEEETNKWQPCDCTKLFYWRQWARKRWGGTSIAVKGENRKRKRINPRGYQWKKEEKRILTALNQAARKRFTFKYGCCLSKAKWVMGKKKRKERKEKIGEERCCYTPQKDTERLGKLKTKRGKVWECSERCKCSPCTVITAAGGWLLNESRSLKTSNKARIPTPHVYFIKPGTSRGSVSGATRVH